MLHHTCWVARSRSLAYYCCSRARYTGADCSIRVCPAGVAWADHPFGNDTAHHTFVECSKFGKCNRMTGECECREGYTGHACERMSCPVGTGTSYCSGHGQCLNLNEAAEQTKQLANRADAFDGTVRLEGKRRYKIGPVDWEDGKYIQGCVCEPGWEGNDCSLRSCPVGDDPMTGNQTDDQQLLDCSCFARTACEGTFRLRFRGASTRPIPFNATVEYLKHFLELSAAVSPGGVLVESVEGPGRPLCSQGGETTRITFLLEHGPLPALEPVAVDRSLDVQVAAGGNASYFYPWVKSKAGRREEVKCSGRGTCDRRGLLNGGADAGTCHCYEAFGASDRRGGSGSFPNCGHFDSARTSSSVTNAAANNTLFGCPVTLSLFDSEIGRALCSGKGANCSADTDYKCNCTRGYTGPGCEYRDCPASRSWFQEPNLLTGRAHEKGFRCSNGGSCNEATGACECAPNFDGAACHTMKCPFNNSLECGGLGLCWSLNKLAKYSLSPMGEHYNISYQRPWDAFKIRTCNCGRPFAVDSQRQVYRDLDRPALRETVTEKTFRGPYAYQSTPGSGYDCSTMECPRGDDVFTTGVNEVQEVRCFATGGAFKMVWRESTSPDIKWNAKQGEIISAFEDMLSIGKVNITFGTKNNNSEACGDRNHSFFVEFMTEFGDQHPIMQPIVLNGDNSFRLYRNGDGEDRPQSAATGAAVGLVRVSRYQKGTKENLECGRQGICNEDTGFCHCLAGLVSGGGTNHKGHHTFGTDAYGHRGDCGFRNGDTRVYNAETRYVGIDPGARFGAADL